MKKYLVAAMLSIVFTSSEQAGTSIVYDPTNGAQIASVLNVMKELKASTEEWKSNGEFLQRVMNEGKEVKRLYAMLEGMICATDDLQLYIGLEGATEVCEFKLEIDMALLKIEGVSDRLSLVAAGTMVLSQYETISSLKDLNDELEQAIRTINNLNSVMRTNFRKRMMRKAEMEQSQDNAVGQQFNVI